MSTSPPSYPTYLAEARAEFEEKQAHLQAQAGISEADDLRADMETGQVEFLKAGLPFASAAFQVLGSLNTKSGEWAWSWTSHSVPPALQVGALRLRSMGFERGFEPLVQERFPAVENEGWDFVAVAVRVLKALGGYRLRTRTGLAFLVLTDLTAISPAEARARQDLAQLGEASKPEPALYEPPRALPTQGVSSSVAASVQPAARTQPAASTQPAAAPPAPPSTPEAAPARREPVPSSPAAAPRTPLPTPASAVRQGTVPPQTPAPRKPAPRTPNPKEPTKPATPGQPALGSSLPALRKRPAAGSTPPSIPAKSSPPAKPGSRERAPGDAPKAPFPTRPRLEHPDAARPLRRSSMIPLDAAPPAGAGRFQDRGPGERSAGPGEVELSLAARAVICVCSLERGRPILSARRDRPNKPEDSGWQFLCGSTGHKPEHGRQVSLQQVLALEVSLSEWIHGPIGRRLLRRKAGDPWTAPMR